MNLSTISPQAAAVVARAEQAAAAAQQAAEAARAEILNAVGSVRDLRRRQARASADLDVLRGLAEFSAKSNAGPTLERYLDAQFGLPYAHAHYQTMSDEALRLGFIAQAAPELIRQRSDELASISAELARLAKEHKLDLSAIH
jgi:hypothetical protein